MKVDKTVTVAGGGLFTLDLDQGEVVAVLDPAPVPLEAEVLEPTVSISYMFIDSGDLGSGPTPDPDPDNPYLYYGIDTMYLGFGIYPIGGII
jgi:hypothetical protein